MFVPPAGRRPQNGILGDSYSCLQRVVYLRMVFLGDPYSCFWRVVDLKTAFVGAPNAFKTKENIKYERVTAAETESSRRDMKNSLILVSNGCNSDVYSRSKVSQF